MPPIRAKVTHVGTASILLELGGEKPLRILTDPVLDPAGGDYTFGIGAGSHKTKGPALPPGGLPPIDLVLLSHDQHADNLDHEGRRLLPKVDHVVTTPSGAKRLGRMLGSKVIGLDRWQTTEIKAPEGWVLKIHAVPAKHGQWPLPEAIVGETTGFILEWPGQIKGPVYLSGDTVMFKGIREIARRFPRIGTAFVNLGCVKFGISGPLRYTFNGKEAADLTATLKPALMIPLHYDGWTHFHESLPKSLDAVDRAGFKNRVQILPEGKTVDIDL